ncbi:glutamate synthase (NADH) large subunit [Frankia casuarinae]|uniref:Glutamate synthase (NADH) large subunit n=2 Tax=Frankia casuarinae (strain DSM 45818 / CECT 9043 / HFP020203 / CcI3) TaxID=106370 RepID=Q2J8M2_FRACC|nr:MULTISPECIES: glutamate synthase large subunit [Frankia]ABD12370.1 glutamate synthase (NADH) large subunit [Frankia casuarinae]ETA02364.1 glutamate synthase (NADH) large subunit [Frankia sp. CcI6]EYT91308.1 glutamate synthase (NADH) large subunit [Frankia casuarinae]KDA44809.1 glutamate synthase (NADH) large subunit [Frankia sp. BMG5.23]OHV55129.1 glutamate synthase subunit alpha [Frankia sp. CgIS1]
MPSAQGLYDPTFEHDACGVGFVVDVHGRRSHELVEQGLTVLRNLDHRGASGSDPDTGDGAGILVQVPDLFLRDVVDFTLPAPGRYAVGIAFLPQVSGERDEAVRTISRIVRQEGLRVLGWREVPVVSHIVGHAAHEVEPRMRQLFLALPGSLPAAGPVEGGAGNGFDQADLERRAFCARKRIRRETGVYLASLSSRTLVYKGMLTTHQLSAYFPDLDDPRFTSAIALVHSRFSTNTFPSWPLAHPYRFVAHNGEINTVRGNRNWMRAREALLASDLIPGDLSRLFPVCADGASDSASFDEVLELLYLGGRSLPHAVLMMIPEAWENHTEMDPALRAFYQFHSTLMEPWDGPASIAFTDGTVIGAVLDRNGLRPSRYWVTDDGLVVMASEVGVLDIPPHKVVQKGRLQPGRMFLVDTAEGRIVSDEEIKSELANAAPYAEWLHAGLIELDDLPEREQLLYGHSSVLRRQQVFGYTLEELRVLVAPMARTGAEPIGSMGTDTPVAVLSSRPRLLFDYFTQLFAQVTNPPLDAIREELVTSLGRVLGPEGNLLAPSPASCRMVHLPYPVISSSQLSKIIGINDDGDMPGFASVTVRGLYDVDGGGAALAARLAEICAGVSEAIADGARIVVLSDRDSDTRKAPIPSLLLTAAVHHHLIRERTRTKVGLIVECGDAREVHHIALLTGYGAAAVNPYLAFESIDSLIAEGEIVGVSREQAEKNMIKALGKGVLKVMSKMGISTVASYTGAQVFEAIGLSQELIDAYFAGTPSRLDGIGLDVIAAEVAARHRRAYPPIASEHAHRTLEVGGEYQWRREGELHLFNPETVFLLQHATRTRQYETFQKYTARVDGLSRENATLRGLFELRTGVRTPVPIEEVEPASEIVKRFATGAMSYGSISAEAHETLAIAMNRLGGKSNTGEGGEDAERFTPDANGDLRRSAVKQVASGRFGVTSEYLANADDIQIKMAQGAKPGEGGQLPGHKVYPWIAKTRHSTPGVGLISPPPHHDIYSIEDLAQLIHDLKNANPKARVHVKLVAEVGVGTVAAGVSKAHADVVLISGHDGGTGASPLTSLKHAGAPWELGLAETQQTLLLNGLRDRIVVQVDGQLKTGRDVIVGALLGAEEFGFATAPLVVAGCVMMRVCHLDTCPVGVATQNPELRRRFTGRPEFVEAFFTFIAEEVRTYLAALGFRSLQEAVGRVDLLDARAAVDHWKASGLDITPLLHTPERPFGGSLNCTSSQDHGLDKALDNSLIQLCEGALDDGRPVWLEMPIRNVNRTVGTMLGYEVTKRFGAAGLPDDTIQLRFTGSAGQSFGAFAPRGMTLTLEGDANDYAGKGLSGGKIFVFPPKESPLRAEENIVAGNVLLYGATGGEAFFRGIVGERFCVRNSGATAVVEGVGDHGCEYMTGGTVLVLGAIGRNFAAGMSGGVAYLYDPVEARINTEMVDVEALDDADETIVRDLLVRHRRETGSTVAARLYTDWDTVRGSFRKVMPRDYKRVLTAIRQAQEQGLVADEVIMAAARG